MEMQANWYQYITIHAQQTAQDRPSERRWYRIERCWNCDNQKKRRHIRRKK